MNNPTIIQVNFSDLIKIMNEKYDDTFSYKTKIYQNGYYCNDKKYVAKISELFQVKSSLTKAGLQFKTEDTIVNMDWDANYYSDDPQKNQKIVLEKVNQLIVKILGLDDIFKEFDKYYLLGIFFLTKEDFDRNNFEKNDVLVDFIFYRK